MDEKLKKSVGERVRIARETQKVSQRALADKVGVRNPSISRLENGQTLTTRMIRAVSQALNISEEWLLTGEGRMLSDSKPAVPEGVNAIPVNTQGRQVPVVSWARAGEGANYSDLADFIGETVPTNCKDPNCYALIVDGDSMEPFVPAGSRIVVAPNTEARTGNLVVARHAETGKVYFKLYRRNGPNYDQVRLESYNKAYPPMDFKLGEFRFIHPVYAVVNYKLGIGN